MYVQNSKSICFICVLLIIRIKNDDCRTASPILKTLVEECTQECQRIELIISEIDHEKFKITQTLHKFQLDTKTETEYLENKVLELEAVALANETGYQVQKDTLMKNLENLK